MCGRVSQKLSSSEIALLFDAEDLVGDPGGRFNVAPTDPVLVVVERDGRRAVTSYRWGLVPHWAESAKSANRMINARAETIVTAPAFRSSFRAKRCIVPVDAFYEWRRHPDGLREPFLIRREDAAPLALAGLWASWRDLATPDRPPLRSCAIVTTTPTELLALVHDRMPVVLEREAWRPWLDAETDVGELHPLLTPSDASLVVLPVGPRVNSVRNDGRDLAEPIGPPLLA